MKKLYFLLILFILVACSGLETQLPILDRSDYAFPCWNGIVVGVTTETEFLKILKGLPDIDQESIEIADASGNVFEKNVFFFLSARRVI